MLKKNIQKFRIILRFQKHLVFSTNFQFCETFAKHLVFSMKFQFSQNTYNFLEEFCNYYSYSGRSCGRRWSIASRSRPKCRTSHPPSGSTPRTHVVKICDENNFLRQDLSFLDYKLQNALWNLVNFKKFDENRIFENFLNPTGITKIWNR